MVQLLREKRKKQQEGKVGKERFQLLHLGFLFQLTSVLWEPTTKSFVINFVIELMGLVNSPRAMCPPGESPDDC